MSVVHFIIAMKFRPSLMIITSIILILSAKFVLSVQREDAICHKSLKIELTFIVDSSQYIDQFEYKYYVKGYLQEAVKRLTISPDFSKVAVILFSNQVMLGISSQQKQTEIALLNQIDLLPQIASTRASGDALYESAYSAFSASSGGTSSSKRIGVFITSGVSDSGRFSIKEGGQLLHDAADFIYVITIKGNSSLIDLNTLKAVATNKNTSFVLDSFSSLSFENIDIFDFECKPQKPVKCKPVVPMASIMPLGGASVSLGEKAALQKKIDELTLLNMHLKRNNSWLGTALKRSNRTIIGMNDEYKALKKENRKLNINYEKSMDLVSKLNANVTESKERLQDKVVELNDLKQKFLQQGGILLKLRRTSQHLLRLRSNIIKTLRGELQTRVKKFEKEKDEKVYLSQNILELRARYNDTRKLLAAHSLELNSCKSKIKQLKNNKILTKHETKLLSMSSKLAKQNVNLVRTENLRLRKEKKNFNKLIESMQRIFTSRIRRAMVANTNLKNKKFWLESKIDVVKKRVDDLKEDNDLCEKRIKVKGDTITKLKDALKADNQSVGMYKRKSEAFRNELQVIHNVLRNVSQQLEVKKNNLSVIQEQNDILRSKLGFDDNHDKAFMNMPIRGENKGSLPLLEQNRRLLDYIHHGSSFPILTLGTDTNLPLSPEDIFGQKIFNQNRFQLYRNSGNITSKVYVSPYFTKWSRGQFEKIHLVMTKNSKVVIHLIFDAVNSSSTNWFTSRNLLESYPWPMRLIKKFSKFISITQGNNNHFQEIFALSSNQDSCETYFGYFAIIHKKGPCQYSDSQNSRNDIIIKYSLNSDGRPSKLLSHKSDHIFTADKFIIYASPKVFEENMILGSISNSQKGKSESTHKILYIMNIEQKIAVIEMYKSKLRSPPDLVPNVIIKGSDKSGNLCNCWYKSPLMDFWLTGTYKNITIQLLRSNGTIGVMLTFDASKSDSTNWFQLQNLIYSHPWSLDLLQVYQFTAFEMQGPTNLNFFIEVVSPTSNTAQGCNQRLAYMYIIDGVSPCFSQYSSTELPKIFAVSSNSGIPEKHSEMEEFVELRIFAD